MMCTDEAIFSCGPTPLNICSCDGPHSDIPDELRVPHFEDVINAGLCSEEQAFAVAKEIARDWHSYGFSAADFYAWTEAGIMEASLAVACRTAGFDPERHWKFLHDPSPYADSWIEALELAEVSPSTAFSYYQGEP